MIPTQVIDRTREATDIVELISGYVRLKQRGRNYVGLCPFHSEKTPSFNVNPARQIYHCFGCGKGGDVFKFLMEHERMGFLEAVTLLAERAHIELPRERGADAEPADRIYRANAVALEYFRKALRHESVGRPARAYLEQRRFDEALSETFEVGYAPPRARGLITYAERHDVGLPDLERAGLVFRDGTRTRDRFHDRLIFPIRNLSGRAIAFGGRDLSGQARAKYLNSPESPVYQKGRVLYGLYESRRKIQDGGKVIVCEGYFDLIRLHEFGFDYAVALSGTAFTPEQARLLGRYAQTAVLLFDADGPGMAAALRSVPLLFDAGLDVAIARLGSGEDPDTFLLKSGAEALERHLDEATGYVAYCEAQAGGSFAALRPGEQNRLIDEMARTVARITDPVRRDLVGRTVWSRFGVSEAAFRKRLLQVGAAGAEPSGRPVRDSAKAAPAAAWRLELLQFLLLNPAARAEARTLVAPEEFRDPIERLLLDLLLRPEHDDLDAGSIMRRTNDREAIALVGRLASADVPFAGSELPDYVRKLRRKRLEAEAQDLLRQMRELERKGDAGRLKEVAAAYRDAREAWVRLEKEGRKKGG